MTLKEIQTLLEGVGLNTHHAVNKNKKPADKYIVWAEDGEAGSSHADNKKQTVITGGTIDLFTRTDFDPKKVEIENVLNLSELSWKFNSYQYEEDTLYHHYEWTFEVMLNG